MSEHPCHNLSNTEKQIFTCRHCMAKFYDPIQRWRHSKNCKKDAPTKSKDASPSPNGTSKREYPAEHAAKAGTTKKRQKKESPLNCLICKSVFTTLEEMKEHVRQPCNKPFVPKPQTVGQPNPDLENFEHQLQQLRDAKGDEIATNQIESLLKAAQTLHQQQQEQQRQQAQQLQNVETEVIPDGGNPDWLYNQGEPVLCSMEEYGGPGFPNYSSIDGSDGMHVVRVEQVSSTPPVDEERSLHTPPISLTTEEYNQLSSQEIILTSSGQETFANHAQTTLSGPVNVNIEKGNRQGCSSNEKFILSTVGIVENLQSQTMTTEEDLSSASVLPSAPPSVNPSVMPSEVRLVGSDGMTVTVVLSPDTSSEVAQETGNPVDEFDLISQVIGEDLNEEESIKEKNRKDLNKSESADTVTNCEANKAPKFSFSPVSNFFEHEHAAESEQAIASEQDTINEEKKYFNTSENLIHNAAVFGLATNTSNGECQLKSKENLNFQSNEQDIGSHLEQVTSTAMNKCLSYGEQVSKSEKFSNFQEIEKNHDCENAKAVQNGVKDHKEESDVQVYSKEKINQKNAKSLSEVKVIKKKPRAERIPKCRVCDKQFKTIELLRKHNKVPCMIRLTRNLTQKVLRPKRLEKPVPLQTKKKKKQKPAPNKPKMITLINRRFSDTSLDFKKDKKGKLKTRRKSIYDFNFCITRSSDYRNASLDVLVQYASLNEKEQHFFHLGLVAKVHLPTDYKTPKSLIKRVLKENGSQVLGEVVEEKGVHSVEDEPPVLEKVVDAAGRIQEDIYILRDEINHDIEPPVLMTVEELNRTYSNDEEGNSPADLECPSLNISADDINCKDTKLSIKKQVGSPNDPDKENNFELESVSEKPQLTEQNSKSCTPSRVEYNSSEKLTVTEAISPLKSPNKTLGERHFLDAIDVASDTFADESEFTKTKLKGEDATKPSYSVTVGLQTDIPTATDKIMYPRSSFILKCLKRLENKHKNVQEPKPLTPKQNSGRQNLFESLENVSSNSKVVSKPDTLTYPKEKETKSLTKNCSEKRSSSNDPVEEVIVHPKPIDPKNLEHDKPTFTIPSNEEILTYADDDVVIRKPPELDSVSPENGRDLLQIIAKTLGIFPSTKTKQESHLNETPKRYKEKCQGEEADQQDGMQIIVMNNTAESNEYTMGIDVINVPKSINDELKEAAKELENKVVIEDDGPQRIHFCDDSTALVGGHSVEQGVDPIHKVPGDMSIPEEVYEFLEDYNTIKPNASKTDQIPTFVTQVNAVKNSIHLIPGPQVKASEVVDIHFSLCSSESLVPQSNCHVFSSSKFNDVTSTIQANHAQNHVQDVTCGEVSSIKTEELRSQHLQKPFLESDRDLPLYAVPVGFVSDDNQTKKQFDIPLNQHDISTFISPNQDINTSCNLSPSTAVYQEGRIQVVQTSNQEFVLDESQIKPAFSDSDVFAVGKVPENDKQKSRSSLTNIPDTNPDPDQLWSRILEDYKTECLQNQRIVQNNSLGSGSIFSTPKQYHRPRTLSNIEVHTGPFISKPELTRSYSHSANSSFCDRSKQKLGNCDNPEEFPSMTCSFSPTNSSHSLKLIFRKEKSPQAQKPPASTNYSEQVRGIQNENFRETFSESNVSSALFDPSSTNPETSDQGDSLPYMIVDTGVEICRKALGAEEDEDISDDDWSLEKETDSQDAVT